MKRILVILVLGILCLSGCGGGGSQTLLNATDRQCTQLDSGTTGSGQTDAPGALNPQSNTLGTAQGSDASLDLPPPPPDYDDNDQPPPPP